MTARLRAGRPRPLHRRAGEHVRLGRRARRPDARVDCPPLPEPVYVDREMWAKIVLNLLSNALKFTFEGGVTVRADARPTARRELTVTDTGIGIDAGRAGAAVRALPPRRRRPLAHATRASGIGLALVAELAALHGGAVGGRERAGRGQHVHASSCRSAPTHLPAEQVVASRRRRSARAAGARASWPRRCAGSDADDGAARRARADGRARGCWSSTTTPTCATTSPAARRPTTRSDRAGRRGRAGARARATRPTWCSPT